MKFATILTRAGNVLRNRVLRNALLWPALLLLAHGMNVENDHIHHYGFLRAPWYGRVILGGFGLQLLLVFVNNLVLIPRLLARRRRLAYAICLVLHVGIISLCYTVGLKLAAAHMDVNDLQQVGMITSPVSTAWSAASIREETQTYFAGNLIWVAVFTMAWYMNDYARQRKAAELAKQQQSETELQFLRSQLAPHFLFNTLNNIYALTLRESSAAPDAMLKLSAILRSLLYESGHELASFEQEAALISAYADLELLRLKDPERVQLELRADGDYSIPPLLWLPVLENIFKHGTRIISEAMFVEFSFVITGGTLTICGRNYCRDAPANGAAQPGIGLANLRRRLQLLYPDRHSFRAVFSQHTFSTEVIIKLA